MENTKPGAAGLLGPVGERVARNVLRRRTDLGMSQRDVAQCLRGFEGDDVAALTDKELRGTINTVSKIEGGKRRVNVDEVTMLAIALDTTPNWLMYHDEPFSMLKRVPLLPNGDSVFQASLTDWATGRKPFGWRGHKNSIGDAVRFREEQRPFEANTFDVPMPDRFKETDQYETLKGAMEDLVRSGTKIQYIVPMMNEVVRTSEHQTKLEAEALLDAYVNEPVPEADNDA